MDQIRRFPPPISGVGGATPCSFLWRAQDNGGGATAAAAADELELKQALLRMTLELESTRATALEELRKMESQALRLTRLLESATRERDEARHALLLLLLHHQAERPHPPPSSTFVPVDEVVAADIDDGKSGNPEAASPALAELEAAATRRGLPEKGRLVEAVMGAGPLLQTLLLAGPLPQWRHPPPDLHAVEIPPVIIALTSNPEASRPPSPSPTSFWNSSPSSSSLESGNNKFQNAAAFTFNNSA